MEIPEVLVYLPDEPFIRIYGAERVSRLVTEDELRYAAREYLAHYGVDIDVELDWLVVYVEKGFFFQKIVGQQWSTGARRNAIEIRIYSFMWRRSFWNTFYHEMDHVLWSIENSGRFIDDRRYRFRPHERRARKRARQWVGKMV